MAGRRVLVPRTVERVATLGPVPVINSFVFLFGRGPAIVNGLPEFARNGRFRFQTVFAPSLLREPSMQGPGREPDLEALLLAAPDVVFTMDRESIAPLERRGLRTVYLCWRQPEDVQRLIRLMGEVFGQRDRAEDYLRYFSATLERVRAGVRAIPPARRPRVLYCNVRRLTQEHLIAEWWIATAGGLSVTDNGRSAEAFTFSLEQMLAWDPDILIVSGWDDLKELYRDSRFSRMKAVRRHRVFVAPIGAHLWANRTSEQPLMLLWAARVISPKAFPALDLVQEARAFYARYFNYRMSPEEAREILNGTP